MTDHDDLFRIVAFVSMTAIFILAAYSALSFRRKYFWTHKAGGRAVSRKNHQALMNQFEIREQTMKTISREIHDNVGQVLSLVTLHLNSIELKNDPVACCKINTSVELIRRAVNDLRDLSKSINAEHMASMGIPAAIRFDLEIISRTGSIETAFTVKGKESRLETTKEIIIYRIVQEGLQNVIKHAKATRVDVLLNYSNDLLIISITDNGIGFDNFLVDAESTFSQGTGLCNMVHRAELIGAELNIETKPGGGTTLYLLAPADVAILT